MNSSRLLLEFAPRAPKVSLTEASALLASALLLGACTVYLGGLLAEHSRQENLTAQAGKAGRKATLVAVHTPKSSPAELVQVKSARQTSLSLMTPWAELLSAVESTPPNVALLAVEPSTAKRNVTITAEAAGTSQMLQYLRALQANPHLSEVALVSHQWQEQAPGTPVRFQVRANWGEEP